MLYIVKCFYAVYFATLQSDLEQDPTGPDGIKHGENVMNEQTAKCKLCQNYFSISILAQFGGYCPRCFKTIKDRERER